MPQAFDLLEFSALTLHTLLLFLYGSGARIHEAVFLETSDVDLTRGTVTFRHTGNRVRTIPLGRFLCDALRKYDDSMVSAREIRKNFFIGEKGGKIRPVALTLCFQRFRRKAAVSKTRPFLPAKSIAAYKIHLPTPCKVRTWEINWLNLAS
jgi:integrase